MAQIDFARNRRQLRRARVQDALGIERDGVNVALNRDRLLQELALAAVKGVAEFDAAPESQIDTLVSLAVTELDEAPTDSLIVVLLSVRVLAADGQFARLSLLAERLARLAVRVEVERPFLALAVRSFTEALRSRESVGHRELQEVLGGTGLPDNKPSAGREQLDDLLACAVARQVLSNGDEEVDRLIEGARSAAIAVGNGLLLAYVDALDSWRRAARRARPIDVLSAHDDTFLAEGLATYVERRGIGVLYPAQIRAIEGGATRDENRVVALPTSSGKTLLAEFRVASTLTRYPGARAIYVAPYRLLARQVERTFTQGLKPLGLSVQDLGTGFDTDAALGDAESGLPDVVICTPERLDALLRVATTDTPPGRQAAELIGSARVLIFDELQLIGRPNRGPRFELVLARLINRYADLRVLGLCAASQGADSVAQWLTGGDALAGAKRPTGTLEIVWEVDGTLRQRARPKATAVASLTRTAPLDDASKLLLSLDAKYRPALAVMTSRVHAENLAKKLVKEAPAQGVAWRDALPRHSAVQLGQAIEEVRALLGRDHPLGNCMDLGVAFHHAGVPTHILQRIEQLAAAGLLRAVCATTTVAEGADLPFRAVVIPHLNFPGSSGRLERDLYLNIIGRAGRANVAVEGMVFVLDSDARTLKDVVKASLWSNTTADRIRGRLADITSTPRTLDEWNAFEDLQSQVMGWLGDGDSYVPDQASVFGGLTFSWQEATKTERSTVAKVVQDALNDLEVRGYALAASPFRLTERGQAARLTGLRSGSVARLERAVERGRDGWLKDLAGTSHLNAETRELVATLAFEGLEVIEHSLWLKRTAKSDAAKLEALAALDQGGEAFRESELYEVDVQLLASWLSGASYMDLAEQAPVFERANALFGGTDPAKRTSDATEYVGKLTYPASWVWAGVRVLAGSLTDSLPGFIGAALEHGVPSEAAATAISQAGVTRAGGLEIANTFGTSWSDARSGIRDVDLADLAELAFTALDLERIKSLQVRLVAEDE